MFTTDRSSLYCASELSKDLNVPFVYTLIGPTGIMAYMHSLFCTQRPTFLLFVLERNAPGDEVSSGAALLGNDLPHLVMAVGALKRCLHRGEKKVSAH